jgi:uncharacterized Ntn-hydrolase superfamily protein
VAFTIIARDRETGALGIGIASYSLAAGGNCLFLRQGAGAVASQAYTNPELGPMALEMLAEGMEPQAVLVRLARTDQDHYSYRQVGIVSPDGEVAVHNGRHIQGWAGHIAGHGFAVIGNVLTSEAVVQAMANTYEAGGDSEFAERLLLAVEAGRRAGGQMGGIGTQLSERSAALVVHGSGRAPELDLRVDAHDSAVEELRRVFGEYAPFAPYYEWRQRDPANAPNQEDWARRVERQS